MNRLSLRNILLSLLAALVTAALAAVFPLGLLIVSAFMAYIGVALGAKFLTAVLAAAAAGIIYIYGFGLEALIFIMLFLPQSIIITYHLANKRPYRSAMALSAVACGLGLYGETCLPSLLNGGGPFDYLVKYIDIMGDAVKENMASLGMGESEIEAVAEYIVDMKLSAPSVTMAMLIAISLVSALLCVAIAEKLLKKRGADIKPMAPFREWQLSKGFVTGSVVMLISGLAVMYTNIPNGDAVCAAAVCITVGAYVLMGLCFMTFTMKLRLKGKGFFVFSIVAMILLLPYSLYGIAMIGAADRMFKMRRNYAARNN